MFQRLMLKKLDGFYKLSLFDKYGVRAGFTSKKYDMGFERKAEKNSVSGGRIDAYRHLGITWKGLVCPSQVHGDRVFVVKDKDRGKGSLNRLGSIAGTDALITSGVNLPIAILTADCLPVFIVDPKMRCIALVHAGWRGLGNKIIEKTILKMGKIFGSMPEDLEVAFGPAIKSCCYEVGIDFKDKFCADVIRERGGKIYFDIAGVAFGQLEGLGVRIENIHDSGICTFCAQDEFFSYRRQGENAGRSMSVMEIY